MLRVIPMTLEEANIWVRKLHRHHAPVQGYRFAVGVESEDSFVRGVAIVGRPVGFRNPQYEWCEVLRVATDGYPNACSKLYGACARAAKELGFTRIQTFTLLTESGTSLRASGWVEQGL